MMRFSIDIRTMWQKYKGLVFYLVFGVLTTIINIASYHLCSEVWGVPNVSSNIISWVLAVTVAYITNKLWVFESKSFAPNVLLPEIWKFISCRLATGVMDLTIMWTGVDILHGPATALKIVSNVLVVVLNYVLSQLVIFKRNSKESSGKGICNQ